MFDDITNRLDRLDEKMKSNIDKIIKVKEIYISIKNSYQPEKTFAGNPIKLIKNRHTL